MTAAHVVTYGADWWSCTCGDGETNLSFDNARVTAVGHIHDTCGDCAGRIQEAAR